MFKKTQTVDSIMVEPYQEICKAVHRLYTAKGRYHTQLAVAELFECCGLPAVCPQQNNKGNK